MHRHRLAAIQGDLHELFDGVDRDPQVAALPLNRKGQAGPRARQPRIQAKAIAPQGQARKPEHRHQPEAAQGRDVDAAGDCHMGVAKVDGGGASEVFEQGRDAMAIARRPCSARP